MAVLKRFRSQSRLEFFANAERLRRELFLLLCRDLGIKNEVRTLGLITHGMDERDRQAFTEIAQRYRMTRFCAEYPAWVISKLRDSVWELTRSLLLNLTAANAIFPTMRAEADQRRIFQDLAIGNCEQLLRELQFIMETLPANAAGYMPCVEMVEKEIALAKAWRKADRQRFKSLPA